MLHLHHLTRQDERVVAVVVVCEREPGGHGLSLVALEVTRNAKNGFGLVFILTMTTAAKSATLFLKLFDVSAHHYRTAFI